MAFTQFPCPSCNIILRVADSTPAQALLRCPRCGERCRKPTLAKANDHGITSTEGKSPPPPSGSSSTAAEDDAALLRKIRRPAPRARTAFWVVLTSLSACFLLFLAVGIGLALWLARSDKASSPPPQTHLVPPAAAAPPPKPVVPPKPVAAKQAGTAIEWVQIGDLRRSQGNLEGAIQAYNRAIEMNPRLAAAYCNRGLTRSDKGDYDGGIADSTKSIELNPKDPFPFINRANARLLKGVDPDASIADATRALELRPGIPAALANRGMARDLKGDYEGALADFDEALALLPTFALVFRQRAQVWMKKKDWDKAEADFTSAVELNYIDFHIFHNRGLCRQEQGNHAGAIEDFTVALRLNPRHLLSYYSRALTSFARGDFKSAHADVDRALSLAPGQDYFRAIRIKIFQREDADADALADAEGWVNHQPQSVDALICRAGVRAWRGEADKARADYAAALKLDNKHVSVYLLRGWFSLSLGRDEEAAKDAEAGLKLAGQQHQLAPYLAILAYCAQRRQHPEQARRAVSEAMNEKGKSPWLQRLVKYFHGDLSAEELLRATGDSDQRTEARAYVGVVQWLSGDSAKARDSWKWVREHGSPNASEYDLALLMLRRLETGKKRTP